ncbi:Pept_C1 domain-containing protein [Meloidogyne graminicola]|uniref:Pept_C1 domain-containing protein n=1 Tax=Meloidogyne graminicola TaxID=189291 RepID=A0A8S9ZL00_9BILA|nr:Pept_C1 domain-containing protein [Meloidogyne graminicola]
MFFVLIFLISLFVLKSNLSSSSIHTNSPIANFTKNNVNIMKSSSGQDVSPTDGINFISPTDRREENSSNVDFFIKRRWRCILGCFYCLFHCIYVKQGEEAKLKTINFKGLVDSVNNAQNVRWKARFNPFGIRELEEFPDSRLLDILMPEKNGLYVNIHQIPNQGGCGSCYAVSAMTVAADRICIHSNGTKNHNYRHLM